MNWEAVGAVGEILGALAVVASLVYLAIQIKSQNRESRIAAVHDVLEAYRNQISVLTDESFSKLYIRGLSDFEGLDDAERMRLTSGVHGVFRVWEEAFYLLKESRLDDNHWVGMDRLCADLKASQIGEHAWELRKHGYSVEFQKYVDSREPGEYRFR